MGVSSHYWLFRENEKERREIEGKKERERGGEQEREREKEFKRMKLPVHLEQLHVHLEQQLVHLEQLPVQLELLPVQLELLPVQLEQLPVQLEQLPVLRVNSVHVAAVMTILQNGDWYTRYQPAYQCHTHTRAHKTSWPRTHFTKFLLNSHK